MTPIKDRTRSAAIAAFLIIFGSTLAVRADEAPPPWLKQAASAAVPAYDKDVPAVVLLAEKRAIFGSDGKLTTIENYAIKILSNEGRAHAVARTFYYVSWGKVRQIDGWTIRSDGSTKRYEKSSVIDVISDPDDVYNEGRMKVIDASRDVEPGYVFGYTVVSENTPLFYQDSWLFQNRLPTLVSKYSLDLPAGWTASSITFNAADVKPQVNGTSYVWEMRGLGFIPSEAMSPGSAYLSPRVAVNYWPADKGSQTDRVFADWSDVSKWATAMHEPQVIVDDEVAAKARELTAGTKTELEAIRAIGAFVQNLQYISVDIGVGQGNGYRPRPSSLVLRRGYGDCKDKENLMRAMLRVLKIEAYPIVIFAGDPMFVREQWPSPNQFNHCIIAVKVSDATDAPTVIVHEKLGRLLIFDATDPYTPVGDLPSHLQGSLALIAAGDRGGLARMPLTPPSTDLLTRSVEVSLGPTGEIKGSIRERANGQTASLFRREVREMSGTDLRKSMERWLTMGTSGAQLVDLKFKDRSAESGFDLDVEFAAPAYGQLIQDRLLVFKPVIVGRRHYVYLTESKRVNPIEMYSMSVNESATFSLPEGFIVEDVPAPLDLDTPIGKYSTRYEVIADKLHFKRSLTMNRIVIPADKYASVKEFFSKIRDAEQSPVVLMRK